MGRHLFHWSLAFVFIFSLFTLPQATLSQSSGGCLPPLRLEMGVGGAFCKMVYTNVNELPAGCTNPNQSDEERLQYANTVRSVECQPQDGYSIALPGDILPDGSFRCPDPVTGTHVNIGWVAVGTNPDGSFQFRWNGGCGAFSATYPYPLPQPTGGPGVVPEAGGRCDSTEALASGDTVWHDMYTGGEYVITDDPASYIGGTNKLSGREACIAYAGMISCGVSNDSVFDPNFDFGTCCQYGVNPNIRPGEIITGCGGPVGGGGTPAVNGGGSATPWTGGAGGTAGGVVDMRNILSSISGLFGTTGFINPTIGVDGQVSGTSAGGVNVSTALSQYIQSLQTMINARLVAPTSGTILTTGTSGTSFRPQVNSGSISLSVSVLNVRSSPSASATVVRRLRTGDRFNAVGWVVGESVEGVDRWWKSATTNNEYIWSGGTVEQPTGAPLSSSAGIEGGVGTGTGGTGGGASGTGTGGADTGANPQLSSTIITATDGGRTVKVGEAWVITITGAARNTPVYVVGGRGGAQDRTQMGTTDTNGNFVLSGTFTTADIGAWTEAWSVGTVPVRSFGFVVSSAYVNDLFAHSIKFNIGQRVKTVSALNVRATPSVSGALLGTQPAGAMGTFEGGTYGTYADGYYWWRINYDTGPDGWSVEDYLVDSTLNIGPRPVIGSIGGGVVDTSSGNNPPSNQLPPPPALPSIGTNNNIGVYMWTGNLNSPGQNIIRTQAGRIKNMGVNKVRISLSSKSDVDYSGGSCITNSSLVDLARRDDFASIISDPQFETVMITAYDWTSFPDCNTENFLNPTFMSVAANVTKIQNEYRDLANYLKTFTGKKFIISNWEGDNSVYCLASYGATASSCPNYASNIEGFEKWVDAYAEGVRLAGASNVFSAVEFNIVRDLRSRNMPSVLYDVLPRVNVDYISYSSYESINNIIGGDNGAALSSDIATILSASGKSRNRLVVGEYGFGADASGTRLDFKNRLQTATNALESNGVTDYFVWQLLDRPSGFGLISSDGMLTESGRYVCGIAGGSNCN